MISWRYRKPVLQVIQCQKAHISIKWHLIQKIKALYILQLEEGKVHSFSRSEFILMSYVNCVVSWRFEVNLVDICWSSLPTLVLVVPMVFRGVKWLSGIELSCTTSVQFHNLSDYILAKYNWMNIIISNISYQHFIHISPTSYPYCTYFPFQSWSSAELSLFTFYLINFDCLIFYTPKSNNFKNTASIWYASVPSPVQHCTTRCCSHSLPGFSVS